LARPVLVQAFTDVAAQRARSATHDTLENLLPHMDEVEGASFRQAALDGAERFCLPGSYIEAQVQGSLLISRDVGEIRVSGSSILNNNNTLNEARLTALNEFAASHNITLTVTDFYGSLNTAALTELRGRGLTVHTQDDVMNSRLDPREQVAAAAAFSQNHQSIQGTREAAQALLKPENSEALTARLLTLLPEEAQEGFLPLAGAALDRVKARFLDNVNQTLKAATDAGQGINTETVIADALTAAAQKPLAQKTTLLRELETLEFDTPAQKTAFSNWVISDRSLAEPAEMRMLHANISALSLRLERLGQNGRTPSLEALALEFTNASKNMSSSIGMYRADALARDADLTFGGGDLETEYKRISFMAAEFLRAKAPALAANLMPILYSPQMSEFQGVCVGLFGELMGRIPPPTPAQREEVTHAVNLAKVMDLFTEDLAQQSGQAARRAPDFDLELNYASPGARALLSGTLPDLAAVLNTDFPQKTPVSIAAFHAPAQGAIQADWSGRRAFHLGMLDSYRAHEASFDETGVHGLAHASRVFIFGTVLGNIMRERGATVDMTAMTCAASAHDSGRQANGPDLWEEDSANIALTALQGRFIPAADVAPDAAPGAALGADYANDFRAQIVHTKSFGADETPTLEAWLMQSADAMDIGRVKDFEMEQWIFLREPVQLPGGGQAIPPDQRLRDALVREADTLRMLSDPAAQARPRLNELATEAMKNMDKSEELMAQRSELLSDIAGALENLRSLSNEGYMAGLEGIIRAHTAELPLLNRYYFQQA
jgi:hypothetical protein